MSQVLNNKVAVVTGAGRRAWPMHWTTVSNISSGHPRQLILSLRHRRYTPGHASQRIRWANIPHWQAQCPYKRKIYSTAPP